VLIGLLAFAFVMALCGLAVYLYARDVLRFALMAACLGAAAALVSGAILYWKEHY